MSVAQFGMLGAVVGVVWFTVIALVALWRSVARTPSTRRPPSRPPGAWQAPGYTGATRAPVPRHNLRVPDERSRLRAHQGHARVRSGSARRHDVDDADVVVFNTCTIREKPDTKLAAYLGQAAARKRLRPDMVIAVGGCYAEAQRERIFELYPFVDVAFGPGSIPHLGDWLGCRRASASIAAASARTSTSRATCRSTASGRFQAWVQVSMGCNSTCAYCIVPAVRGREQSRRPGDIVAEVTRLAARRRAGGDAARPERQLVGPRPRCPTSAPSSASCCGRATRVEGIERIRFTSPHPKDFREPVIAAMAECATVCEHVHLPLQSGSSRMLKAMRRTYDRERYLALVERLRDAIPDLALGTDVIVGFPGETEEDFARDARGRGGGALRQRVHLRLLAAQRAPRRPRCPTRCRTTVKRERIERLVEVVQRIAAERNAERVGRVEEVLVEGPSRTDAALLRGRTRRNTTVNFTGDARARASSSTC